MNSAPAIASSFTIKRRFDAPPWEAFNTFADPNLKAAWFSGPPDQWTVLDHRIDFREGGDERVRGWFKGSYTSDFSARYHVIRRPSLIVYVYDMYLDDRLLSTSLSSFDFVTKGDATDMVYVEQGVYFDGEDGTASRKEGTLGLFDRIDATPKRSRS